MKKILSIILIMVMVLALAGCGNQTPQEIVSEELDLDITGGDQISASDNHGGFHGDGITYIVLQFDDNAVLGAIEKDPRWTAFPLDESTEALVYGAEAEAGQIGPFFSDGQGNALIPEIQNGYYILIDRHADTDADILERYSFNFTVGLYDTDHNILYFGKMDT